VPASYLVENRLPGGDHEIVIGRVRHAEIGDNGAAALVYWRGSYLPLGGARAPD
jgi:flavin reductase (DIM6/NTAB) family NADH-FMN oxidoreductase RutF